MRSAKRRIARAKPAVSPTISQQPSTLWELVASFVPSASKPKTAQIIAPARPSRAKPATPPRAKPSKPTKADQYEQLTRAMLAQHGVRVRKWRSSMSGCAWMVTYRDGTISRLIESPKPRGPMSAAVFLHEIGHHAIGFNVYKPRCLEEYHAWVWSLNAMEAHGITITDRVRQRMADSLAYAIAKAKRRGIKRIPPELVAYER